MFGKKKEEEPAKETEEKKASGNKFKETAFKIMTITIYLGGVGGTGFLASLYYVVFWVPEVPTKSFLKSDPMVSPPFFMQPSPSRRLRRSAHESLHDHDTTYQLAHQILKSIRANYSKMKGEEVSESIPNENRVLNVGVVKHKDGHSNSQTKQGTQYTFSGSSYSNNYLNIPYADINFKGDHMSSIKEKRETDTKDFTPYAENQKFATSANDGDLEDKAVPATFAPPSAA